MMGRLGGFFLSCLLAFTAGHADAEIDRLAAAVRPLVNV